MLKWLETTCLILAWKCLNSISNNIEKLSKDLQLVGETKVVSCVGKG